MKWTRFWTASWPLTRLSNVTTCGCEHQPEITLTAAYEQNLFGSPVIRAIFKARELALGSTPDERARPQALLPQMLALGWGILAEVPGQEIVMGAVTKPWDPNPRFRALDPEHFAAFDEPDYVKIVWSLRADATWRP